jgi:magnesium transporter
MHVFGPESDPAEVQRAIEAGLPFWLDVPPDRFGAEHPAARALGVGGDRLRRLEQRADRSAVFVDDDRAAIVAAGARHDIGSVERVPVLILAGAAGLVTVRDTTCPALDHLRASPREVDALAVLDALADRTLTIAEGMEDEVEDAESGMLQVRSREPLVHITRLRQQVSDLVKIAREQRGMVERSQEDLADLPVRFGDAGRRVRDLVAHLARTTDAAASARQTIAEALNLYMSRTAENLTRIATVLLPLTVVSGFFGMNFGWMVDHIDSLWSFLVFGVGGMAAAVAGVRLYLRRKGYA